LNEVPAGDVRSLSASAARAANEPASILLFLVSTRVTRIMYSTTAMKSSGVST